MCLQVKKKKKRNKYITCLQEDGKLKTETGHWFWQGRAHCDYTRAVQVESWRWKPTCCRRWPSVTKDNSLLHREAGKWANGFTEIRRRVVTLQIMEILQHILHLWKWPCRWKWGWGRGEMGPGRGAWQKQRVQLDRFTTFHGSTHPCCYRKDSGV